MTRNLFLSFLALLCLNVRAEDKVKKAVYVKNAILIDMLSDKAPQKANVLIEEGKIKTIDYNETSLVPENAEIIDATGKYLLPGLVDAHVHVTTGRFDDRNKLKAYSEDLLKHMLAGGITSVRDVGGDGDLLKELKKESALHQISSPNIYYSAFIAGPSYYKQMGTTEFSPCQQSIDSSSNIEEVMAQAKAAGATGVKLYAAISVDLLHKLAKEAKRQGLGVWGHATVMAAKPIDAVNAGMEVMSHAEMLKWEQCPSLSEDMFENYEKYSEKFKFDFSELNALFIKMKEKNIILDATCYHGTVNGLKEAAIFTEKAHEMGVKVSAGTDYFGDSDLPYIHDELETLVKECDFSPFEALRSATIIAAETFKMEKSIGSIEEGKIADLLLLNSNPLEKISNTRDINLVIKNGIVYKK